MYQQIPVTPAQWCRMWSRIAAIVTFAIGSSVLLGWSLDVTVLKRVLPALQDMSPLMAVSFVIGSAALLVANYHGPRASHFVNAAGTYFLAVGLLWMASFMGYFTGHFNDLIFGAKLPATQSGTQGGVAAGTSANLALLGCAILLRNAWSHRGYWLGQLLLGGAAASALVAGLGYLYGARTLNEFGPYFVPMALHTSLAFLLLSTGYLCLHPERGFMATIANAAGSGLTTRRLAIGGVVIPLFLGWLTWEGQRLGWFLPLLSVVVFAVQTMFGFLALILWNGVTLRKLEEEKARYEFEIRESEERFRLLAESAFEGIVVTREGRVLDANRRFCQMMGYDLQDVVGRPERDFYVLAHPLSGAYNADTKEGEGLLQGRALRLGGESFEVELETRNIPFQGSKALVVAIRDITERKEIDKIKDEFVSVVSHELRTPLTSVHGALGLVLGGVAGPVSEGVATMLELARRNSNRLLLLINDILDMQKIESGVLHFQAAEVELGALALTAVESNFAFAQGLGVELVALRVERGLCVTGDPDRLTQVITNLLSNACKFSYAGSQVEVKVLRHDEWVRLSVKDYGSGIAPEFQTRIFEKFAQGDSSDTRSKGGTGLGLSISRALVERMGGNIDFESTVGAGSTFYFDLPLVRTNNDVTEEAVDQVGIFAV